MLDTLLPGQAAHLLEDITSGLFGQPAHAQETPAPATETSDDTPTATPTEVLLPTPTTNPTPTMTYESVRLQQASESAKLASKSARTKVNGTVAGAYREGSFSFSEVQTPLLYAGILLLAALLVVIIHYYWQTISNFFFDVIQAVKRPLKRKKK